jgi:hypothetical protein
MSFLQGQCHTTVQKVVKVVACSVLWKAAIMAAVSKVGRQTVRISEH